MACLVWKKETKTLDSQKKLRLIRKKLKLICSILFFLLAFSGCTGERKGDEWSEKSYSRTEDFPRTFKYYETKRTNGDYGCLTSLADDIDVDKVLAKIDNDIGKIETYLDIKDDNKLKVFILDETPSGTYYVTQDKDTIFIPYDEIENDIYRQAVVYALTDIQTNWKLVGLAGVIFDTKVDYDALSAFYSDKDNMNTLSMCGVRFLEGWNREDNMEMASQTAIGLTEYLIHTDGFQGFLDGTGEDIRRKWLSSLDVTQEYSEDQVSFFDTLYFNKSDVYDLVAYGDTADFYVIYYEGSLCDCESVENFISKVNVGSQVVNQYIYKHAKEKVNKTQIGNKIVCDVSMSEAAGSHAKKDRLYINIVNPYAVLHEYTHMILWGDSSNFDKIWVAEGVADYFSKIVCSDFFLAEKGKKNYYNSLKNELPDGVTTSDKNLYEWFHEVYEEMPSYEDFDMRLIFDYTVLQAMENPKEWEGKGFVKSLKELGYGDKSSDYVGSELSMAQAMSFSGYLIETYSLSKVIDYLVDDISIEECFGYDYETLKEQWMNYLYSLPDMTN